MDNWVVSELRDVRLGDRRLEARLVNLVSALSLQPEASVPQACGTWASTKAAYRFLSAEHVSAAKIRAGFEQSTLERMQAAGTVLAIQDTTELDFTGRPGTEGLGYLDSALCQGLKVHSILAATTDGCPLGLAGQEVWARTKKEAPPQNRELEDRESYRWLRALKVTQELAVECAEVVVVCDREADIYDLFACPRRSNVHLLVRAVHDRKVQEPSGKVRAALESQPVVAVQPVTLRGRDGNPTREVKLSVRFAALSLLPPRGRVKQHKGKEPLEPVPLFAVLAEEEEPQEGHAPVGWLLLTTKPVKNAQDALERVRWYTRRWLIERYHFVLKSGCRLEQLQLRTAERLEAALAVYCIVAWHLLWLTHQARRCPDAPCDTALTTEQWQALACSVHKTNTPPDHPPPLRDAVRWIAQLGGFLARKHDGEPGVQTIWKGLQRLNDITEAWILFRHNPAPTCG
jgi:hypothetical protein